MTTTGLYFAYGSNMAVNRLKTRILSAQKICIAELSQHQIRFHKFSRKDGSGKCDASYTGKPEDKVHGVLYSLLKEDFKELDRYEGQGKGYERKCVAVCSESGEMFEAETYFATNHVSGLRPLDWYKEHMLRGAKENGLPTDYIAMIESVAVGIDVDAERRARELAIYI